MVLRYLIKGLSIFNTMKMICKLILTRPCLQILYYGVSLNIIPNKSWNNLKISNLELYFHGTSVISCMLKPVVISVPNACEYDFPLCKIAALTRW